MKLATNVLNINDLDIIELENRLEMTVVEASSGGWIEIDNDPPKPCNTPVGVPCPTVTPKA